MHKAGSSQRRLLPVDVSNNGSSVMVSVGKANAPPPYRIENRCPSSLVPSCQSCSRPARQTPLSWSEHSFCLVAVLEVCPQLRPFAGTQV